MNEKFKFQIAKPKTVSEYALDLVKYLHAPDALVELKVVLTANLVSLLDTKYKPVKLKRAEFNKIKTHDDAGVEREKPLSDAMIDKLWDLTSDGVDMMKLDVTIRSYKLIIDAINTSVTWEQTSAKMQK